MTQATLGKRVGLSRTSITNIEKGRQHVALHVLYDLATELEVQPEVLMPKEPSDGRTLLPNVLEKLSHSVSRGDLEWMTQLFEAKPPKGKKSK